MRYIVLIAVLTTLGASSVSPAAEPFYEHRLREGLLAHARGEYAVAVRELRVACFGLFGEPDELAACWTHLALAEVGVEDVDAFTATAERILAVEYRLGAYSRARLTQESRLLFEEAVRRWLPDADLRTVPASADGPRPSESTDEDPEPAVDTSETETATPTPEAMAAAPELATEPELAAEEPGSADAEVADIDARLEAARALISTSRDREVLAGFFEDLSIVANQHPEHRGLQLTVAEVAYRLRRWQDAVIFFQRGGVSESERPERQFYYAVALAESGDLEAAARVLELCLPRLQKTEFVRTVAERVLGRVVE